MVMFYDRYEAGHALAGELQKYQDTDALVLALPRGGVPVGFIVAKELHLPLDLMMIKKLAHPYNDEFAIGSVNLKGYTLNPGIHVPIEYVNHEVARIRKTLEQRYHLYTGDGEVPGITHRDVIIVDDGLATGSTMLAAIKLLKQEKPKKIIVAVPLSPLATAKQIAGMVDEFICISIPKNFYAVSQFYDNFDQVSDEEVVKLMQLFGKDELA